MNKVYNIPDFLSFILKRGYVFALEEIIYFDVNPFENNINFIFNNFSKYDLNLNMCKIREINIKPSYFLKYIKFYIENFNDKLNYQ